MTLFRSTLANRVPAALEAAVAGSRASLRGSLARGTADAYSDIDVEWLVPAAAFPDCLDVAPLLSAVQPVAEGEWSRPASALANALGAVKAVARGRSDDARGLLDRGFERIGSAERATGEWAADIARLASACSRAEPELAGYAAEIAALA